MKKLFVLGPQHSGTKIITCLLDLHPDVSGIYHQSFPGAGRFMPFSNMINQCDHLIIVDRYDYFLDKANEKWKLDYKVSKMGKSWIKSELEKIKKDNSNFYDNNITFVSLEMLISYEKIYIRNILKSCGLDPNKYDYSHLDSEGNADKRQYLPKDLQGKPNKNFKNFTSIHGLSIRDVNKKYIEN